MLAGVFAAGIVLCGWVLSDRAQAAEAVPGMPAIGHAAPGESVTADAPAALAVDATPGGRSNVGVTPSAAQVAPVAVVSTAVPTAPAKAARSGLSTAPRSQPTSVKTVAGSVAPTVVETLPTGALEAVAAGRVGPDIADTLDVLGGDPAALLPETDTLVGNLPDLRPTRNGPSGMPASAGTDVAASRADHPGSPAASPAVPAAQASGPQDSDGKAFPRTAPEGPGRSSTVAQPGVGARSPLAAAPPAETPQTPAPGRSATSSSDDAVAGSVHRGDAPCGLCAAPAPAAQARVMHAPGGHSPHAGPHDRPGDVPVSPA